MQRYPLNSSRQIFTFRTVIEDNVSKGFKKCLKNSKGSSTDGLSLNYFKECFNVFVDYFVHLFNKCISMQTYPEAWKISKVVPLRKIPEPEILSHTRPIYTSCHFDEIFDAIISPQILDFFEEENYLSPFQFGYRKDHSTQMALINKLDDIRSSIHNNKVVLVSMMDYSAAFPSIDQMENLKFCRICNFYDAVVLLLHDYHTPGFFFILSRSRLFLITSGIKQGSGLEPVLFVRGANSVDSVPKFCKRKFFVDDEDFYLDGYVEDLPMVIGRIEGRMNADLELVVR